MNTTLKHATPYGVQTRIEPLLEEFFRHLAASGYAKTTMTTRRLHLRELSRWLAARQVRSVTRITKETLDRYARHLHKTATMRNGEPLSVVHRREHIKAVRSFFQWLCRTGHIAYNPAETLKLPRPEFRLPRNVLSVDDVERIMACADDGTPDGIRKRALLEMLYSTGIRRGELCTLRVGDVDRDRQTVRIVHGKGNRERMVPIGKRALAWLKRYEHDVRRTLVAKSTPFLFLNDSGLPFRPERLSLIVRRAFESAGIEIRGACHIFRHTAATLMFENGADIRFIQEFLGHETIQTTQIYTRVSKKRLCAIHALTHPAEREETSIGRKTGRHEHEETPNDDRAGTEITRKRSQRKRMPHDGRAHERRPLLFLDRGSFESLFRRHTDWMKRNNFSDSTIRGREVYLAPFLEWCTEREFSRPEELTAADLEAYRRYRFEQTNRNGEPFSAEHRRKIVSHVKSFFRWLADEKEILFNPAGALEPPRPAKRLPKHVLSHGEVTKILALPDTHDVIGIRDRALLETLYSTGIRRVELAGLKLSDVDAARGTLFIRSGKGGRDRIVPIGERALHWIDRYLEVSRPELTDGEGDSLFLTYSGKPIPAVRLTHIVLEYVRRSKVRDKGACLIFRHTAATLMLENGADIRSVQEFLGHERITTTQIYTHVGIRKLKEVHERTHPARLGNTEKPKERARRKKRGSGSLKS